MMIHEFDIFETKKALAGDSCRAVFAGSSLERCSEFGGDGFLRHGWRGWVRILFVYLGWFALSLPGAAARAVATASAERVGRRIFEDCESLFGF